ncbi:MAG: hypothetical protein ACYC06_09815 [Ilumatobacteraceae bacterium]
MNSSSDGDKCPSSRSNGAANENRNGCSQDISGSPFATATTLQPTSSEDSPNSNSPTNGNVTTTTSLSSVIATSTTTTSTTTASITELVAGASEVVVNGLSVQSEQVQKGNAVTVRGANVVARVSGLTTRTPDSENSGIILAPGRSAQLSLQGLQPDSEVLVFIFSEPRQLGTLRVDSLGGFYASIKIPSDLEPGSHTLMISGLDKSGSPIKLKFGLVLYSDKTILASILIWSTVTLLMLALLGSVIWSRKVNRKNSEFWIARMRGGTV